ncbi:MAG: cation transporter [Anaerolineales bacterium]|nr:cation transporter [Anaerolineales bacterium]MCX7756467.1 cation transporter [Anaerolineales bacterium]MDW8278340.1 cation transporter [Anaerolineales bacterium]
MNLELQTSLEANKKLWLTALVLGIFTVVYNLLEGLVSVYFGASDETIALFGFGVDSFIEVLSGVGIIAMIVRIRQNPDTPRSQFEQTALRVTGAAFYILAVGLVLTIVVNLLTGHRPETTLPGIIISAISIVVMLWLVAAKRRVGRALNSPPILADANCTLTCVYMSIVLLAASLVYQVTGLGFVDSLGAAGLVYFSYKEGQEAFQKAAGMSCACEDECGAHS